jgi:hypothetical protein
VQRKRHTDKQAAKIGEAEEWQGCPLDGECHSTIRSLRDVVINWVGFIAPSFKIIYLKKAGIKQQLLTT